MRSKTWSKDRFFASDTAGEDRFGELPKVVLEEADEVTHSSFVWRSCGKNIRRKRTNEIKSGRTLLIQGGSVCFLEVEHLRSSIEEFLFDSFRRGMIRFAHQVCPIEHSRTIGDHTGTQATLAIRVVCFPREFGWKKDIVGIQKMFFA